MAADLGLSAKRAVAAMALLWETPSVLEEVAPLLDSILRGMSAREYEDVHDFVLLVQRSGGAAANLTSRAYSGLVRENEFSLRTQVALTTRSTEEVTVDTLMSARENDLFADPVILLKALEAVVLRTLRARPEDQGNLLESARRLFKHSRFGIGFGVSRSRSSLSRASADLILGDADGYPLDLVTAADTVLTGSVITKRSVATIARARGWAAG